MMRLVYDEQIPSTVNCLLTAQCIARQKVDITKNELFGFEGVFVTARGFIPATLFIEQTEPQVESPQHLDKPLVQQGTRHEDQYPASTTGQQLLMKDESRLDRLPEADLVCEQDTRRMAFCNLVRNVELMRQEGRARAKQAAYVRLVQATELAKGTITQLEPLVVVKLAAHEPLTRPAELNLAIQQSFRKDAPAAVITPADVSHETIFFLDSINQHLPALDRAHAITRCIKKPYKRRRIDSVVTVFSSQEEHDGDSTMFDA